MCPLSFQKESRNTSRKYFSALFFDEMLKFSKIWSVFGPNDLFVVPAFK